MTTYKRGTNGMRAIHPGEHLREDFLKPLNMSANALAIALRLPAPRINDIVRERRGITPETAVRLAKYFGTTAQYWMNWQTTYDLKMAAKKEAKVLSEIIPLNPVATV
ncbi:Uncharacterized HTH-type transcriptional regulator ybaQ [Suttonella ornithocola]|uniref:Uncharacterized HTH-type transcriptional regulator ybaQ n=2 Tax=Suttonella ornithocola TaxID=279832 RepID=A0A380MX20_9GAMM|nr:Uncharacterized HTH-type transcriptional regulator ybaQ [Suttonella ornithocola]